MTLPVDVSSEEQTRIPHVTISEAPRKPNKSTNSQSLQSFNDTRLFPMANSPQIATGNRKSTNSRNKVHLAPHHSALDWEKFKKSNNVKNIDPSEFPVRISKAELARHNTPDNCWISLNGKIYNISAYLDYHPGGVDILLKFAGKECLSIFMKYHRWVNYERILDDCFIGFLVK